MNRPINQQCQRINCQDILEKKLFPVWFFTNERIGKFLARIDRYNEIKQVFSIGGGGDFAFSLLSRQSMSHLQSIEMCDIRPMAAITINLKSGLFDYFRYKEILDILLMREPISATAVYKSIREKIAPLSRQIIKSVLLNEGSSENKFLGCLRRSGMWFKYSFWQINNRSDYLPYLNDKAAYQRLQAGLDKISIHAGDFKDNLELFEEGHFDLIYTSNIFDSKQYCREPKLYLQRINDKLQIGGLLFVIAQTNPARIIRLIEGQGFEIIDQERHRFSLFASIVGHYSYSLLLFKKHKL